MLRTMLGAALLAGTAAQAGIVGEAHRYTVGDTEFEGYVARNTDLESSLGTVVIVHDWDGLTDYERRRAEMLAALGYTAVAIDVYGVGNLPTTTEENRERSGALNSDRELFRERLLGSLEAARSVEGATDEVVMIGYCFGGGAVLEAARAGAETSGFVSFHGGLGTPEGQDYAQVAAPVVLLQGSADPVTGPADLAQVIERLQEAGVEHRAEIFGGARHSYTIWGSDDYDLEADRASWEALSDFLSKTF